MNVSRVLVKQGGDPAYCFGACGIEPVILKRFAGQCRRLGEQAVRRRRIAIRYFERFAEGGN